MNDFHHISDGRARSDSAEIAFRKIFIGGLSYSTDEEKLKKYFKSYGSVQDAVVMKDPVTKRSRGFGFITFCDVGAVDNVLSNEPHTVDGRKVEAKRAVPRSEMMKDVDRRMSGTSSTLPPPPSSAGGTPVASSHKTTAPGTPMASPQTHGKSLNGAAATASLFDSRHALDPRINSEEYAYNKIFVGGLHYDTRDPEFRVYFERYGKVISAEVMFNRETHKSRGFGFIVFEHEESAIQVCADKEHVISGKAVEVKRAIPRSKMNTPMSSGTSTPVPALPSSSLGKFAGSDTRARSKSELPLSGNSSTLAMSFGSPAATHKAASALSQPLGVSLRTPSYAAALKNGNGNGGSAAMAASSLSHRDFESLPGGGFSLGGGNGNAQQQGSPLLRSAASPSFPSSPPPLFGHASPSTTTTSSLSLFPQVGSGGGGSSFDSLLTTRSSRAFSEPIVRLEPLIDFSSFNSRNDAQNKDRNGSGNGSAWLLGESTTTTTHSGSGGSGGGGGGPPSPEAWARFISTLGTDDNHNPGNGSGHGNGRTKSGAESLKPSASQESMQFLALLSGESALWPGDATASSAAHDTTSASLSLTSSIFSSEQLELELERQRPRARTCSRDESGSLILGITRNSRANSLADHDLSSALSKQQQSQQQRRLSRPHEMLDEALSELSQMRFEGETSPLPSAQPMGLWS